MPSFKTANGDTTVCGLCDYFDAHALPNYACHRYPERHKAVRALVACGEFRCPVKDTHTDADDEDSNDTPEPISTPTAIRMIPFSPMDGYSGTSCDQAERLGYTPTVGCTTCGSVRIRYQTSRDNPTHIRIKCAACNADRFTGWQVVLVPPGSVRL